MTTEQLATLAYHCEKLELHDEIDALLEVVED